MLTLPMRQFGMELNSQLINKYRKRLSSVEASEVLGTPKYSLVNLKSYLDEESLLKIAEAKQKLQNAEDA